ncbi:Methyl-accepting chemotaxis protein McpA [compost metagenome]
MIKVREEVQSGSQVVQQAGTAFGELLELIKNINSTIQSVSAAAQQVSAGSEEVSASVEETAQITGKSQQMVVNIRETAENQLEHMESHSTTVGELHEQAKALQEAVRKFKI